MSFRVRIEWTDEQSNPRAEVLRLDEAIRPFLEAVLCQFRVLSSLSREAIGGERVDA